MAIKKNKAVAKKSPAKKAKAKKKKTSSPKEKTTEGNESMAISIAKYDLLRQNILAYIWRNEEISFKQLLKDLEKKLAPSFEGSVSWHLKLVKLDLEDRGIIEQVPGKKPPHIRLKQRMEKPKD